MSKFLTEVYELKNQEFSFDEAKSKDPRIDGENVIGLVEGQFFVPNGTSRNKRFYSKKCWEKTLSSAGVRDKLEKSLMFGTIGHYDGPISEQDLSDGKVSHFMGDLKITNEDSGYGKAYILNTPAGRNLRTYLKAGCQLYVSSRAQGQFKENVKYKGMPVIDEESYRLHTFDFVIDPGFLQAKPSLLEQLENIDEDDKQGESKMSLEKLLESAQRENAELKAKLELAEKNSETVKESLNDAEKQLADYVAIGKVDEINAALDEAKETITKQATVIENLSDENDNTELVEKLAEYSEIGEPEEINSTIDDAVEKLESYCKLGEPEEIAEALESAERLIESYASIGTPAEITEALDEADEVSKLAEEAKIEEKVMEYSKKFNQTVETSRSLIEKLGIEDAAGILENMQPVKKQSKKASKNEDTKTDKADRFSNSPVASIFEACCGN